MDTLRPVRTYTRTRPYEVLDAGRIERIEEQRARDIDTACYQAELTRRYCRGHL